MSKEGENIMCRKKFPSHMTKESENVMCRKIFRSHMTKELNDVPCIIKKHRIGKFIVQ